MEKLQLKKFFIILFELAIVLTLYNWWDKYTGLSVGSYLLVAFILFWFLNWLFGKWELGPSVSEVITLKIFPRMTFSQEWFGKLLLGVVVVGFFLSKSLFGSAFLTYFVVFVSAVIAGKLLMGSDTEKKSYGLLVIGFAFGIMLGSNYASNVLVIIIFILGNLFLYLGVGPGERERDL